MERVSIRQFTSAAGLIREPVVLVYTFPRNDPRYGQERELGIFLPAPAGVLNMAGVVILPDDTEPEKEAEVRALVAASFAPAAGEAN
jgi:hypothetical protein